MTGETHVTTLKNKNVRVKKKKKTNNDNSWKSYKNKKDRVQITDLTENRFFVKLHLKIK